MTAQKRLDPRDRREALLTAALELASTSGVHGLRRDHLAERAGVSQALVTVYLGNVPEMRRKVMRAAVKRGIIPVVARGLAVNDPHAKRADPVLKQAAADFLAKHAAA